MATYKCMHENLATRAKCNRVSEGYAKVGAHKFRMCKRHANSEGYTFIPYTEDEAIKAGVKPTPKKAEKPTSIFGSNPKDRKRKK